MLKTIGNHPGAKIYTHQDTKTFQRYIVIENRDGYKKLYPVNNDADAEKEIKSLKEQIKNGNQALVIDCIG